MRPLILHRNRRTLPAGRRTMPSWRRALAATAMVLAMPSVFAPVSAAASEQTVQSFSCASGMNTATTGWATCWGGPVTFRLILNCYFYPQVVTDWYYQPSGSHTIYASCPSWSHITGTFYQTQG